MSETNADSLSGVPGVLEMKGAGTQTGAPMGDNREFHTPPPGTAERLTSLLITRCSNDETRAQARNGLGGSSSRFD